jgi:hypothetical protein
MDDDQKKFIPQLAIDTEYLKGFYRMGDGRIFYINLRASLVNDDLSNDPNFGQIHLVGQNLNLLKPTYILYKNMHY